MSLNFFYRKKEMNKNFTQVLNELFAYCNEKNHRSIILMSGKNSVFQLSFIHYLWKKNSIQNKQSILWCYQNKLFFKKLVKKEFDKNFTKSSDIRYCYYKETKKILGNTYGMCILSEFESMTPNSMARIVESVQGGGTIIFLMDTSNYNKNLHELGFEIYKNFKNQSCKPLITRFLDRFFLSLTHCQTFLTLDLDSELPFKSIQRVLWNKNEEIENFSGTHKNDLIELIKNLGPMEPLSCLLSKTKTFDQARAFLSFSEAIADKKKLSTIVMTSGRGRGKSATLGLSAAAAIAFGYGNIYVTSPDPENLHSFFAFLLLGLKALGYSENKDFEIVQNFQFRCIDRILVNSSHHQTIKFIFPTEIEDFKNFFDLLIIDEAAAIPISILEKIGGTCTTFISSTIDGYEGSGKTFTLKLLKKIKNLYMNDPIERSKTKPMILREIFLNEPIRYSSGDPVEKWLNHFLCLDSGEISVLSNSCPSPGKCRLYLVDRNSLFSFQIISNLFLQKIMNLFSSSHYKNSPDDLQMMCDAPSHRIFVLIPPFTIKIGFLPDILSVLHISYEGQINKKFVQKYIFNGLKMNGDMLPWVISRQFLDPNFGELSGLRIIRIVTSFDSQKMGYGSKTVELLTRFITGHRKKKNTELLENNETKKQKNKPAIISDLKNKFPPKIDYLGVSFSVNLQVLCFWKKNGFQAFIFRDQNDLMKNCQNLIMLKEILQNPKKPSNWFGTYRFEFSRRFLNQIGSTHKKISSIIVHNLINCNKERIKFFGLKVNFKKYFSSYDFYRIRFFNEISTLDFELIFDLIPVIGKIFFWGGLPNSFFSSIEIIILIAMGLQYKTIYAVKNELSVKIENILKILTHIFEKFKMFIHAYDSL